MSFAPDDGDPRSRPHHDSDPPIRQLVVARGGVITHAEALRAGLTRHAVLTGVRTGLLHPLRRGVYTLSRFWDGADARSRHVLQVLAHQRVHPELVATGESAAIILSLPTPDGPPANPQLTARRTPASGGTADRRGGRGDRGGFTGRRSLLADDEIQTGTLGIRVTTTVRTVLDCARSWDRPWGLAVADAAIHSRGVDPDALIAAAGRRRSAPGTDRARWVAEHARRDVESPLESLGRALIVGAGLPEPTPQVWVRTRIGRFRVDLLDVDHHVVTEADGRGKYATRQDVWSEKRREDALREAGLEVVRFTMADYRSPDTWLDTYRRALVRGRRPRGSTTSGPPRGELTGRARKVSPPGPGSGRPPRPGGCRGASARRPGWRGGSRR
jgi:hypothetical protein